MTSIPLGRSAIRAYAGDASSHRGCRDISSIYLAGFSADRLTASVAARIPASSTTRQGHHYEIQVWVRADGSSVVGSSCTCPAGDRCKHVHKVLCRIAQPEPPIGGPDREARERLERRRRLAEQARHASVYIAFACKSDYDSGSDYRRSHWAKDSFDQEVLGVFFSRSLANQCAKDYVRNELGHALEDDDDDMDGSGSDGEADFEYDSSEFGLYREGDNAADKVWVEEHAIEGASPQFRR
jgi:hypothetical protein